jgi:hypothetical protein
VSFFGALVSALFASFLAESAGSSSLSPRLNGSWSSSSALGSSVVRGCHLPPLFPVAVDGDPRRFGGAVFNDEVRSEESAGFSTLVLNRSGLASGRGGLGGGTRSKVSGM